MEHPRTPTRNKIVGRWLTGNVAKNSAALYLVLFSKFILPMVSIPYLSRILGPDEWGYVLLARAYAIWLMLVVDYGFDLSATRQISANRDRAFMSDKASQVLSARVILAAATVVLSVVAYAVFSDFRSRPWYLILAWCLAVAQGMDAQWYFMGVERMRTSVGVVLVSRVLAVAAIFVWIRQPGDGPWVLAFQAAGAGISTLILNAVMWREVSPAAVGLRNGWSFLASSWHMFAFKMVSSVYTATNVVLLGYLVPQAVVAFYGGAERITRAVQSLAMPGCQAVYPRINRALVDNPHKASSMAHLVLALFTVSSLSLAAVIFVFAHQIIHVMLGGEYGPAVGVLRVMAGSIPAVFIAQSLSFQWMVPLKRDQAFVNILLATLAVDVALLIVLVPRSGALGAAWASVIGQYFCMFVMAAYLWRLGALKFHNLYAVGKHVRAVVGTQRAPAASGTTATPGIPAHE